MENTLLELLGLVLELIFEVGIEITLGEGVAWASRARRRFHMRPWLRATVGHTDVVLATLMFTLLGLGLGFLSALVIPHSLFHPSKLHGISLLISPLITGLFMGLIGRSVRRRGRSTVRIESFGYGFTFAFALAFIRFLLVH
jgi:hypothetical protein